MSNAKNSLRQRVLRAREGIPEAIHRAYSIDLIVHISSLPAWKKAKTVLMYLGIKSEFDPTPLVEAALSMDKTVVLPRIQRAENRLEIRQVRSLNEDLVSGVWGLKEPNPLRCPEIEPARLDCILVPGVAFDLQGNRMGYGAGFYDRLLSDPELVAPRIAACFPEQLVDSIPTEAHDLPVDTLVMPDRIVHVGIQNPTLQNKEY